jgi:hypothetical protein
MLISEVELPHLSGNQTAGLKPFLNQVKASKKQSERSTQPKTRCQGRRSIKESVEP